MAHVGDDDAGDSLRGSSLDLSSAATALRSSGAEVAQLRVEAASEPWTTTGLTASQGAPITWLANGDASIRS